MEESLHDADGFPRGDVPLHRVLPLKREFHMLQNDHCVLMRTIEAALKTGISLQERIHASEPLGIIVSEEHNEKRLEAGFRVGDIVAVLGPLNTAHVIRFGQRLEFLELPVRHVDGIKCNMRQFGQRSHD